MDILEKFKQIYIHVRKNSNAIGSTASKAAASIAFFSAMAILAALDSSRHLFSCRASFMVYIDRASGQKINAK